jgi:CHAT domain-containing protein
VRDDVSQPFVIARSPAALAWMAAMVALVVPAIWVATWPGHDERLKAAVATVLTSATERPLDTRLTGETTWRPVVSARRGPLPATSLSSDALRGLAEVQRALASSRTSTTLSAYARTQLVVGRPDDAVLALEEATVLDSSSPGLWSDLAAAYLARAHAPERASDLPRALDAIGRAVALNGAVSDYWFNKAIILERLNLRASAADAWRRFVELDATSLWAEEAGRRLGGLKTAAAPVGRDAGPIRDRLFDEVLPRWAGQLTAGAQTEAGETGRQASAMVASLERLTADRYASDVVAGVLSVQREPGRRREMLDGITVYRAARRGYVEERFERALPDFLRARDLLTQARSPLSMSAVVYAALSAYRLKDHERAHALLASIRDEAARREYHCVVGRIDWTRGLMWLLAGRIRESADGYNSAIDRLGRAAEESNRAFVVGLLATNHARLGDVVRLWQARVEALRGSAREGVLLRAASEARRQQWPYAAREFAEAAVRSSRSGNRKALLIDSLRWLATIESELGQQRESLATLQEARQLLNGEQGLAWDRLRAEVDIAAAASASRATASRDFDAAGRALHYFRTTTPPSDERLPEIHLVRARLARMAGRLDAARAELIAGLSAFERMREFVTRGADEATLGDVARSLSDELVDMLAAQDQGAAFAELEKARAWDLAPAGTEAIALSRVRTRVPEATTVLVFMVVDQGSYLWTIRRGASELTRLPIGRKELASLVAPLRFAKPDERSRKRLTRLLLTPARRLLQRGDVLAIVPDGPLHLLPFGALEGQGQRYLIQEHPILLSPSVSRLLDGPGASVQRVDPVLAIGNPAFDRTEWPDLPDLPSATREAAGIAATRPGSTTLIGAAAGRTAVIEQLSKMPIVHFAGHAVVNTFTSSQSALVLAGRDRLTAGDVRTLSLDHLRLVVLASCDSAGGYLPRSDGPLGLARAFHAAGASTVVASMWSVSDASSESLFRTFYAELSAGRSPAQALQAAQIQAIASPDLRRSTAEHWSSFVITGSLASSGVR